MLFSSTTTDQAAVAERPAATRPHLAYLDGLRACAALYVVLHHIFLSVWNQDIGRHPGGLTRILTAWLSYGHYAVSVFIVLSGFCLMLPVVRHGGELRGGARVFFRKRARRILPPFYLAMALSLLFIGLVVGKPTGTLWDRAVAVQPSGVLAHLFLVHNLHGGGQINYVFWSVAVEWQIYFLFPLFVLCWRRFGATQTALAVVAISYVAFVAVRKTILFGLCLHYVGLFALGMLGATIAFGGEEWEGARTRVRWGAWSAAIAVAAMGLSHLMGTKISLVSYIDVLVGISVVCLLVMVSGRQESPAARFLSWPPLAGVGVFSYSLYLIHAPLLQTMWQYAVRPLGLDTVYSFLMLLAIGLPAILAGAYLFFLGCERPFMNRPS